MPDKDARDSWFEVEVDLPNGAAIKGRSIPFRAGLAIKMALYKFSETLEEKDLNAMLEMFEKATGVTEAAVLRLCPSITILELTDLVSRFIYLLRPGRTAAQGTSGTPGATAAPGAGGAAGSEGASTASSPPSAAPA